MFYCGENSRLPVIVITQRKPRRLAAVLTSPLPRVPTTYREQVLVDAEKRSAAVNFLFSQWVQRDRRARPSNVHIARLGAEPVDAGSVACPFFCFTRPFAPKRKDVARRYSSRA